MANPTTNYGFIMPTSTDLVTDLPADFDVFGQAVDTQMLTNANAAIAKTIVDAKGDIIAATAADTVSRLAVGANNTVLTADSSTATGLKWATPASGGKVLQVVQATTSTLVNIATTTFTDTGLSATITPSATTSKILVFTMQAYDLRANTSGANGAIRMLRDSTVILSVGTAGYEGMGGTATGATAWTLRGISSLHYLDSPATVSATTYKTQGRPQLTTNSQYIDFQPNSTATSTIILMEIGA